MPVPFWIFHKQRRFRICFDIYFSWGCFGGTNMICQKRSTISAKIVYNSAIMIDSKAGKNQARRSGFSTKKEELIIYLLIKLLNQPL